MKNFCNLRINESTISALSKLGIKQPTAIQSLSIDKIKENCDLIAQSPTGSGKTLAFLIPILEMITTDTPNIKCIILSPTRELAIQTHNATIELANEINTLTGKNIRILAAYGGKDINSQMKKLSSGIDILIATPGRLLDHLARKTADISKTEIVVLDEVDQMLLMGFRNEVDNIMKYIKVKPQFLGFSATITPPVKKLIYRYSDSPVEISASTNEDELPKIKQQVVVTTDRKKLDDFCTVLEEDRAFMAIIFCRTKRRVNDLEENLSHRGFDCKKIHSDIGQPKRERIIKDFRNLKFQYLIATDVASRGLDIDGITHIYNYDFPELDEDYIHRIGRSGRIGKEGIACSMVTEKNFTVLENVEKKLGKKIEKRTVNEI